MEGDPLSRISSRLPLGEQIRELDRLFDPSPWNPEVRDYDSDAASDARRRLIERHRGDSYRHPSQLPYDEFLQSDYWLWLAALLKAAVDCICEGCGEQKPGGHGLDVHHKTYEHRGFEYPDHLDDLEVLCRSCHSRRHPNAAIRR
jgi:hypothetical protein